MVSFKAHVNSLRRTPCSAHLTPVRVARSRPALLSLPHELLLKIASHIVAAPGILPGSSFISAKPAWRTSIAGFASASRDARDVALRAWFRVLILWDEEDWNIVGVFSAIRFSVKEIFVYSQALSPTTPPDALLAFPALCSAHINAHNDVTFDPRAGYTYYTLLPHIPRGLKRLAIAHAHAPDAERLESLVHASESRDGIRLEELRLGRCTLFDCATEGCSYWLAFPHDHDAYFSDDGAVEYATSIAHDLLPLRTLRVLHLGVYLTPHVALSTHQHHHAPFVHAALPTTPPNPQFVPAHPPFAPANTLLEPANVHLAPANAAHPIPPNHLHPPPPHHLHLLQHPHHRAPLHCPSLWAAPCAACLAQFGPATKVAEHAACTVLGGLLPWIEEVSWAGYFERYGRGVSRWIRGREDWVKR